uniref:Fe2OG dioxygenase domain-containing protein n=1 Tax=Vannella robusta TaxID=1487602 RepID=A0A7S4M8Q9_9EUKA|mmetsp:Transcript_14909/g.18866  ORF Transcript_14909/g.18866 Transcript_14909/m.18866 type:complete len:279 (+) Transcript_14909:181-1017(+)
MFSPDVVQQMKRREALAQTRKANALNKRKVAQKQSKSSDKLGILVLSPRTETNLNNTTIPIESKYREKKVETWNLLQGGAVELVHNFLPQETADELFEQCKYPNTSPNLNWQQEVIRIFGRKVIAPRYTGFVGENANLTYSYSNTTKTAVEWSPLVQQVTNGIEEYCNQKFNVALLNWYETGQNYIGWHSDSEKDMPPGSKIASVSLGMTRPFQFQYQKDISVPILEMDLKHGDLLIMGGTVQKFYKHSLPKLPRSKPSSPRLNFTFRLVAHRNDSPK